MENKWTDEEIEQIQKKSEKVASQLTKEHSFGFCKAILSRATMIIQWKADDLKFS